MLDMRVVDDPEAYKLSKVEATSAPAATQVGTPPTSASVELSLAKSAKKERSKSSESEGTLIVTLPADGSAYSDPFFC